MNQDKTVTPISIIVATHDDAEPSSSFSHAVKITLATAGQLEIIDIRQDANLTGVTNVRATLERWGLLLPGSSRHDVEKLGIHIKKIIKSGKHTAEIKKRLQKRTHDLLVIGVGKDRGIKHLFGRDIVAYLSGCSRQTTLYIPDASKPFINPDTGIASLNKILMPVAEYPPPDKSLAILNNLKPLIPNIQAEITWLHYGDVFPAINDQIPEGFTFNRMLRPQDGFPIARVILQESSKLNADLIIMTTNGRDTISQRFAGSITEQVVAKSSCPVLAVAAD
jgi:nucleotide-binding universal stress UspA family protein